MKIVHLHIRGMHLSYLGCYGNDWVRTPALDQLAAEGVVFDQHFADRVSLGSNRNSGAAGPQQIEQRGIPCRLLGNPTFGEIQSAIRSLANDPHWYLQVGLNSLAPPWPRLTLQDQVGPSQDSEQSAELALEIQNGYALAVEALDEELSQVVAVLDKEEIQDELCLIVTSEEGQTVDEDRPAVSPPWLHEELIHVPLIIRLPGCSQAGRRVAALTQANEVLPTVLDFQEVKDKALDGRSLRGLLEGRERKLRESIVVTAMQGEISSWAVRADVSSVLLRLGPEPFDPMGDARVYIKPDDRWEVNNVCQHHLDLAEETHQFINQRYLSS